MKVMRIITVLLFVLGCIIGAAWNADVGAVLIGLGVILLPVCVIGAVVGKLKRNMKARQPEFERELAARREARRRAETIVEVSLLGGGSEKYTRYGLKGAVVGGLLFNVPGAIVGAMIPKGTKQKQRFLVKYEDGHTEIKEVFPGSDECKELLRHVK